MQTRFSAHVQFTQVIMFNRTGAQTADQVQYDYVQNGGRF